MAELQGNSLRGYLATNSSLNGELGFKGERGYSAYEIAVQHGYVGTEEEWLEHLAGELSDYVSTDDVVDNLTSTYTTRPLSANQGKVLKDLLDVKADGIALQNAIMQIMQSVYLKTATYSKTEIDGMMAEIDDAISKNIITATINTDVTLTTNNDTPLTLISSNSIGDKLSVSEGKIIIGSGVHKVLIGGKGQYSSMISSTSQRYFKIKKNATEVLVGRTSSPSNTSGLAISAPSILLDVSNGDEITASVQGTAGDVVRSGALWTYLTIEVVS